MANRPRFWETCLFRADHLTFFCVKESGSIVGEGPARRDGSSFLSGVLNIEWHRVQLTPVETPVPIGPLLETRTAKVEQAPRETFRPEWAYVGLEAVGLTSVSPAGFDSARDRLQLSPRRRVRSTTAVG